MLAIVAALREEVQAYLDECSFKSREGVAGVRLYQSDAQPQVVVVEGGMGRERAEAATREVIERLKPGLVISAGFAGAVRPGLRPGDLFVCDPLMYLGGPAALWRPQVSEGPHPVDVDLLEGLAGNIGAPCPLYSLSGCLSVSTLVPGSALKRWIGEHFPVSVIDMEGYWVSRTAATLGVPHLVVRSVFDTMEQHLPSFVGEEAASHDNHRWRRAIPFILANPRAVPELLRLRRQAQTASASLARLLAVLVSWSLSGGQRSKVPAGGAP